MHERLVCSWYVLLFISYKKVKSSTKWYEKHDHLITDHANISIHHATLQLQFYRANSCPPNRTEIREEKNPRYHNLKSTNRFTEMKNNLSYFLNFWMFFLPAPKGYYRSMGTRSSKVGKNDFPLQSRIWPVAFLSNRQMFHLLSHRRCPIRLAGPAQHQGRRVRISASGEL